MRHTPAPWTVDDDTRDVMALSVGDAPAYIACQPAYPSGRPLGEEEVLANIRLISAAPDLLQLAIDLIDSIDGECEFTMWDDGWQELYLRAKRAVSGVTMEGTDGKERSLD